jgi:hypothetical protein
VSRPWNSPALNWTAGFIKHFGRVDKKLPSLQLFVNQRVPPYRVRFGQATAMISCCDLELHMNRRWNSVLVGSCNVIGLALLALSVTAGGSAVRAAGDSTVLDSVALEPLVKLADIFQAKMTRIEASVVALADSLTTKRVAAQELCVADESGAQTCITKAQLDALLKGALQTAQAVPAPQAATSTPTSAAPVPVPHTGEQAACPEKCVAPDAAIAAAARSETPPAVESPAAKETAVTTEPSAPPVKETAAAKESGPQPTPPDTASADAKEVARPKAAAAPAVVKETAANETAMPDGAAAAVPPSAADHRQSTSEAPAEAAIATLAKPEIHVPAKASTKQDEPTPTTTGSAVQEPKAVPAEVPAASEHKE